MFGLNKLLDQFVIYESPDFVDLDEVYGFSQTCSSGTAVANWKSPCNAGMTK